MLPSQRTQSTDLSGLPEPDAQAIAHSHRLVARIEAEIKRAGGAIDFSRFMQMALYEPGLGYYSAGASKLGQAGDFITAPEISALFSFALARQCEQVLQYLETGSILELGAGTGRMAADVMLALESSDSLPEEYLILETSADLRQRQQRLIQDCVSRSLFKRFRWLEVLPEEPLRGLVLANEVLDALPVERICYEQDSYRVMQVASVDGHFVWQHKPVSDDLQGQINDALSEFQNSFSQPYTTEINTLMPGLIRSLSDVLQTGLMLFIDYGYPRNEYYHPERSDGTLLSFYRHRAHNDPLLYPGLQDITASVDFTALAEAALSSGLTVSGYSSQAYFLFACGLEDLLEAQDDGEQASRLRLSSEVKRLTLPSEMGERFKVMALSRELDCGLLGFSLVDQRERL